MRQTHVKVRLKVNGIYYERIVESRKSLADFLREDLELKGVHLGCEHGVCGACTVLVDGNAVRSCLMFAVQANGREVITVEGLVTNGELHPVQRVFLENFAVQCGFCTPGFLLTAIDLLSRNPNPTRQEIREGIAGNLCRCTGYQNIVKAIEELAKQGVTLAAPR